MSASESFNNFTPRSSRSTKKIICLCIIQKLTFYLFGKIRENLPIKYKVGYSSVGAIGPVFKYWFERIIWIILIVIALKENHLLVYIQYIHITILYINNKKLAL